MSFCLLQIDSPLFLCNACGRREYSLQTIFMHYRMDHHTTDFKCFGCQALFDNEGALHAHYVSHHPDLVGHISADNMTGNEACIHCDQIFDKSAMLLRHVRFAHLLGKNSTSKKSVINHLQKK